MIEVSIKRNQWLEQRIKIKLSHWGLIAGHKKMDAQVIEAPSKNLLIIFILQIIPLWWLRGYINHFNLHLHTSFEDDASCNISESRYALWLFIIADITDYGRTKANCPPFDDMGVWHGFRAEKMKNSLKAIWRCVI